MKKRITLLALCALMVFTLVSCGSKISESKMKKDLQNYLKKSLYQDDAKVIKLKQKKSKENGKTRKFLVDFTVVEGVNKIEGQYTLVYNEKGDDWKLTDVRAYKQDKWKEGTTTTPKDSEVEDYIKNYSSTLYYTEDGNTVTLNYEKDDVKNIKIKDSEYDKYKGYIYDVSFNVESEMTSKKCEAKITMDANKKGEWDCSIYELTKLESEFKGKYKFDKSDDDIKKDLAKAVESHYNMDEGTFDISTVKGYKVGDATLKSDEDKTLFVPIKFSVNNKVGDFDNDVKLAYEYKDGWELDTYNTSYEKEIKKLNLEGKWVGEFKSYNGDYQTTIDITSVSDTENGDVTATISMQAADGTVTTGDFNGTIDDGYLDLEGKNLVSNGQPSTMSVSIRTKISGITGDIVSPSNNYKFSKQ